VKRVFIAVLMSLIVAVFWVANVSADVEDPTGTLQQIKQINDAHQKTIDALVANIRMDYHPELGTIKTEDYPVNTKVLTPEAAQAKFISEMEGEGYEIIEMTMTQNTLSGPVLVEHSVSNRQVFVWHNMQNADVLVINGVVVGPQGLCYKKIRVWIQTCTNGAGYWAWQTIQVPCDSVSNYTMNYYSTLGLVTPYPHHEWQTPPPLDPTGTLQRIHELNTAHRAQIDDVIKNIKVDEHPVYGCIKSGDYPMDPKGMTLADAEAMIGEDIPDMKLMESSAREITLSGKALFEHNVNGNITLVWHEYDHKPVYYAEALFQEITATNAISLTKNPQISKATEMTNPGAGYCWVRRRVWVPACTNGDPGHYEWRWFKVPCGGMLTENLQVNYSVGAGVLIDRL